MHPRDVYMQLTRTVCSFTVDENQQSQLLYGEAVYVLGTENDAYFMVSAPNQLVYQNNTWIGYPGNVSTDA